MNKKLSRSEIEKRIRYREIWLKVLSVIALMIMIAGLGIFIYIQTTFQTRTQLENPANVRVERYGEEVYLRYEKVKNASAYRFSINDMFVQVGKDEIDVPITNLVQTPQKYKISVQAIANDGYKNSDIVYADEFIVMKTLEQPLVNLDQYESKLIWTTVEGADSYEVTVIKNNDLSTLETMVVLGNECSIGGVVEDYMVNYEFTVKAVSENQFINSSPSSEAIGQKLKGKLATPTGVNYDKDSKTLSWNEVPKANSYTVVLIHGNNQPILLRVEDGKTNLKFENNLVKEIGSYEAYVYANNVQTTDEDEEIIWLLASDKSETVKFSVYEKLKAPTNLISQKNSELMWFSWDLDENALSYTIVLVGDDKIYEQVTYANEINIPRGTMHSVGSDLSFRVKANCNGYYLESDFSTLSKVNNKEKYAKVTDIRVLEIGKKLSFIGSTMNEEGTISQPAENGYHIKITSLDGQETYLDKTFYSTSIDTSSIFTEIKKYKISITVNSYKYFEESEATEYIYGHKQVLQAPNNVQIKKIIDAETGISTLKVCFEGNPLATDYTIWIDGVVYKRILANDSLSQYITTSTDETTGVTNYEFDFVKVIYGEEYANKSFDLPKKFMAKVRSEGDVATKISNPDGFDLEILIPHVEGYLDSEYSTLFTYVNMVKLQTPEFIRIDTRDSEDETVILSFTDVSNAINYQISIESVTLGSVSIKTTIMTVVNIYDIIYAGDNIIKITALGRGYYENSEPCIVEYNYKPTLKAPSDVEVIDDLIGVETHYFVQFTSTRFAEAYEIYIKKTHELQTIDGVKQVVELTDSLPTIFNVPKGEIKTKYDITDYLNTSGYGKYEIKVRSKLDTGIGGIGTIFSDDSNVVNFSYYDKQPAPTNLAFNSETLVLTFDEVPTALNGYIVKVSLEEKDGSYSATSIEADSSTVDLSQIFASFGGVGKFIISARTKAVESMFLGNSDWATPINQTIKIKLTKPSDFVYYDSSKEVWWTSDVRMEYEHLKITFSNKAITNKVLVEKTGETFNARMYDLTKLIAEYGYGYYKFEVKSFSTKDMVEPSDLATYIYTKYEQLSTPTLISVTEIDNRVYAKFTTVENAKTYAVVAKLPTQQDWNIIKKDIVDTGSETITVDIKQGLVDLFGANEYDIAVVAMEYEYYLRSDLSNKLTFELWLVFDAPENLRVEYIDNKYYAMWDSVSVAETYTIKVDTSLISDAVNDTRYDLTEVIGDAKTGIFKISVNANSIGYYYQSLPSVYDFYLQQKIETPTISFDETTQILTIDGENMGFGYNINIDYYANDENGESLQHFEVLQLKSNTLRLANTMELTGLGIYKIAVQESGDGINLQSSDWAEIFANSVKQAEPLTTLNVDKRKDSEEKIENYILITKPADAIYENALVEYKFYEITSLEADITEGQETDLEIISAETEFLVQGLKETTYYKVVARVLGAYDSKDIYETKLSGEQKIQALNALRFYTSSQTKDINISTFGNKLSTPIITSITMNSDKKLEICFNQVLNAQTYTLIVKRESKDKEIYNKTIDSTNPDATLVENAYKVEIPVTTPDFSNEYDIYNIVLYANEVVVDGEVAYKQSANAEYEYEYISQLAKPVVSFYTTLDGKFGVSVHSVLDASGYKLELTKDGITQSIDLGTETTYEIDKTEYGKYQARAKAIGDKFHKDSEWGETVNYTNALTIGKVGEIRIIHNGEGSTPPTRIYAEWDAVENAKIYGVKILKDGVKILEENTNKTYYDLITIFRTNGFGVYLIYAKTNSYGNYMQGQDDYESYAEYTYKGQFEVPSSFRIEEIYEQGSEFNPTTSLSYRTVFAHVNNAVKYVISIYSAGQERKLIDSITLSVAELDNVDGVCTADITEQLGKLLGGNYIATIKVDATVGSMESPESEDFEFVNHHLFGNPKLRVEQNNTPKVKLWFNYDKEAVAYSLYINNKLYKENGETFVYPTSGYIEIYANHLNVGVGSTNTFSLKILGKTNGFYYNTFYGTTLNDFKFKLEKVEGINITQDNKTTIPNGTSSNILLEFNKVYCAESYKLFVGGDSIDYKLNPNEEVYNISSIFANKMPGRYSIDIVAYNGSFDASNQYSEATRYYFDYVLILQAPNTLDYTDSAGLDIFWTAPANLESFTNLASQNLVSLSNLQYKIKIYYITTGEDILVITTDELLTTDLSYSINEYIKEAGEYRIEVYTLANGKFEGSNKIEIPSKKYAKIEYKKVVKLPSVTDVKLYKDGNKVKLSFTKIELFGYINAVQNIRYEIYLNGKSIIDNYSHDNSTNGIDITDYVWGGDNYVYIITKDADEEHYIPSDKSETKHLQYEKSFIALANATVYNDSDYNKQYLRFDKFAVNGLTATEVLDLKYTLSFYDSYTGELLSTRNDYTARQYNNSTFEIDITTAINSRPGTYIIKAKINEFSKQTQMSNGTPVSFKMQESKEISIEYIHKLRAEILKLNLLVIDEEGNERVLDKGLEMREMWLTFDVEFSQEYLNNPTTKYLKYVILIDEHEYELSVPYDSTLIGQTVTAIGYMTYNSISTDGISTVVKILQRTEGTQTKTSLSFSLFELLERKGFNIYKTGIIRIKAKSTEQGHYLESLYQTNALQYDYRLRYKKPKGLEVVVRDDGQHYLKWDEPTHPNIHNYYELIESYKLTVESQGIITDEAVNDPHKTKGSMFVRTITADDIMQENGYLYYCIETMMFAGHNKISIKCNESQKYYYYESETASIEKQTYTITLDAPQVEILQLKENKASTKNNSNLKRGVEIVITNYDSSYYNDEIRKTLNYNLEAVYKIKITSQSQCMSQVDCPTQPDYMDYNVEFKVNRKGIVEFYAGESIGNVVWYTIGSSDGKLHIKWLFAEPGEYTYTIIAVGNDNYFTNSSEETTMTAITTYNAPSITSRVTFYHIVDGKEVERPETADTEVSKVVIEWQTDYSKFYGAQYRFFLYYEKDGNPMSQIYSPNDKIENTTRFVLSEEDDVGGFREISRCPGSARYGFNLLCDNTELPKYKGSEEIMTYYTINFDDYDNREIQNYYTYKLKMNTPSELQLQEYDGNTYITFKKPQIFDFYSEQNLKDKLRMHYKIVQNDTSFNLGSNKNAIINEGDRDVITQGVPGINLPYNYFCIDVTGQVFPEINKITVYFLEVRSAYYTQSDSAYFEAEHVLRLTQLTEKDISVKNVYTNNKNNNQYYVSGMLLSFNNVQFNKYFAYRLRVTSALNREIDKDYLLMVDPSRYSEGNASNYSNVKCYEIQFDYNDNIISRKEVTATGLYTRTGMAGRYSYSSYNFVPCESSNSYNNKMTFLLCGEEFKPDRYDFKLTAIGDYEEWESENYNKYSFIKDMFGSKYNSIKKYLMNSQTAEYSYVMQGTLVPVTVQMFVKDKKGNFTEATASERDSLAFVYSSYYYDDDSNVTYPSFNGTSDTHNYSAQSYLMDVYISVTTYDFQAKAYYITYLDRNGYRQEYLMSEQYYQNSYNSYGDECIQQGDKTIVRYNLYNILVNLPNDKHAIEIIARNTDTVPGPDDKDVSLYDNLDGELSCGKKYVSKYNKVPKPQLWPREWGQNQDCEIDLYYPSTYVTKQDLSNTEFTLKLELISQADANTKPQISIKSKDISKSYDSEKPSFSWNSRINVPYSYIRGILDQQNVQFGDLYVRAYIDANEREYFWDSDWSDEKECTIHYRAEIFFPLFAMNEEEYDGGTFNAGAYRYNVYTKYDFYNSSEAPSNMKTKYVWNTSNRLVNERWSLNLKFRMWDNSQYEYVEETLTGIQPSSLGQTKELSLFGINNTNSILYKLFKTSLDKKKQVFGSYSIEVSIADVYKGSEKLMENQYDIADYDKKTLYFTIKYKLLAPKKVHLNKNIEDETIDKIEVEINNDSMIKNQNSNSNYYYNYYADATIKREVNNTPEIRTKNQYITSSNSNLVTINTDRWDDFYSSSGTFTAKVKLTCSSDYVLDSDEVQSNQEILYLRCGIESVAISIIDEYNKFKKEFLNDIKLTINVRKLKKSSYEGGNLEDGNDKIRYELVLISAKSDQPVKTYNGTKKQIESSMGDNFKALRTFTPGDYYFKIKVAERFSVDYQEYNASAYYYVSNSYSYKESDFNSNPYYKSWVKSSAYKCVFVVGYNGWNYQDVLNNDGTKEQQSLRAVRGNSTYKGLITGAEFRAISNNGVAPSFVEYQVKATGLKYNSNDETSTDIGKGLDVGKRQLSFKYGPAGLSEQNEDYIKVDYYGDATTRESYQKVYMVLYINMNEEKFKTYSAHMKNSKVLDYVKFQRDVPDTETIKGVKYAKYSASPVPKRQRLSAPSYNQVELQRGCSFTLGAHTGCNHRIFWDNKGNDSIKKYVKNATVKYYYYYTCNMLVSVYDSDILSNPRLFWNGSWYDLHHFMGKKRTYEIDQYDKEYLKKMKNGEIWSRCTHNVGNLDHDYDGARRRMARHNSFIILQIMSNSNEYDDSAIIRADDWGSRNPFKDYPAENPLPDYDYRYDKSVHYSDDE